MMDQDNPGYTAFFDQLKARAHQLFPPGFMQRSPQFEYQPGRNRLRIFMGGMIKAVHYEICFRKEYHEIALHFESTEQQNLERLSHFAPHLAVMSRKFGYQVKAGKLEDQGWKRVWIALPVQELNERVAGEYTSLFGRFVAATFPILDKAVTSKG